MPKKEQLLNSIKDNQSDLAEMSPYERSMLRIMKVFVGLAKDFFILLNKGNDKE